MSISSDFLLLLLRKYSIMCVSNRWLQSKDNTFRGHTDSVDQLCWHPSNCDLLVTASGDKTVRLWDARSRKPVATIATKGYTAHVHDAVLTASLGLKPSYVGRRTRTCHQFGHKCKTKVSLPHSEA